MLSADMEGNIAWSDSLVVAVGPGATSSHQATVNKQMAVDVVLMGEGHVTLVTDIGTLLGVHPNVRLQVTRSHVALSTVGNRADVFGCSVSVLVIGHTPVIGHTSTVGRLEAAVIDGALKETFLVEAVVVLVKQFMTQKGTRAQAARPIGALAVSVKKMIAQNRPKKWGTFELSPV